VMIANAGIPSKAGGLDHQSRIGIRFGRLILMVLITVREPLGWYSRSKATEIVFLLLV
jgi:hypothetical protein